MDINTFGKITSEQFRKLVKCKKDIFFFATFIYVINPVLGRVRFDLYPYQIKVLWYFLTKRFNIILKFRQAGITELISLYCLWLAMFHSNKNIQIISIKDTVAKKVLKKIKYMYKNLPDWMKMPIINGRSGELGTSRVIEFANGSLITSIPTTEDAGRSEALSLLVIDEAAIVKWASQIWAAAFPTLSTGGSAIVNSTPFGIANFFHKTWVDACSSPGGDEDFNPIRLHWQMHPDRDENWYKVMSSKLGRKRTAQEIDGDFLSSGDSVFDLNDIRAIEEIIPEVLIHEKQLSGNLVIVRLPRKNEPCFIGVDVATGRARDFSAFSIMNREGEELGYMKAKISIDRLADILMKIGKRFNWAVIAAESNDIGLSLTKMLQLKGYPNLYYSTKLIKEKGKSKPKVEKVPGWYTTLKNRPVIIDELETDIRNNLIEVYDPFFVQEAYTFIYDSRNRPVAMGKENKSGASTGDDLDDELDYTDDSILAKSITNFIRKGKVTSIIPPK